MAKNLRNVVCEELRIFHGNHHSGPVHDNDGARRPPSLTPSTFQTVGEAVQNELCALDPAAQQQPESTLRSI